MSVVRMDEVARDFHVDTLILALIGVLVVTRYAVLGDLTPTLAYALWLAGGILIGGVLLITGGI